MFKNFLSERGICSENVVGGLCNVGHAVAIFFNPEWHQHLELLAVATVNINSCRPVFLNHLTNTSVDESGVQTVEIYFRKL